MGEVLKLNGHRRHESKQIVIGQPFGLPPFYVDSEGTFTMKLLMVKSTG